MQPVLDRLALGHRDHIDGRPGLVPGRDADDVAVLFDNMPVQDGAPESRPPPLAGRRRLQRWLIGWAWPHDSPRDEAAGGSPHFARDFTPCMRV